MATAAARRLKDMGSWLEIRRSRRSRPRANEIFARISRQPGAPVEGNVLCEALWDNAYHWLRLAMFRNAVAEIYGGGLIGVFPNDAVGAYYSLDELLESMRALPLTGEEVLPTSAKSPYLQAAERLLGPIKGPRQILELELPKGFPAYSFYDGVLKSQQLGSVDCSDPNVRHYLGLLLQYLDFYDELLDRRAVQAVVVSHGSHLRYTSLIWAALRRKVPVFVINYVNESITIRKLASLADYAMPVEFPTVSQRDALSPEMRQRLIATGREYLKLLRSGQAGQINVVDGYLGDRERYRDRRRLQELLGVNPARPNAVIMTSCWPDFPHMYGRSYYTDFQDWLELTLEAIADIKDCNWILKPHPAERFYGDKVTLAKLVHGRLSAGVFLWPEGVSGNALDAFADVIVTCIGTAGIEHPAMGKTVLGASSSPYEPWGFCHHTLTAEEYRGALKKIVHLEPPDARQQEDAQVYAALTYTSPLETRGRNGEYIYPWGALGYRLWPGLPDFAQRNSECLQYEIRMMRRWLESGTHSYNVFKGLNPDLWGK